MVTNPVDVLTHVCLEVSGWPEGRVFGTGTTLDTSRFRFALANRCLVAVANVHAFIVGEHGDFEWRLWSSAIVAGRPSMTGSPRGAARSRKASERLFAGVRDLAYEIIAGKGATHCAVGLTTARVLEAVLDDEQAVMP